MLIKFAFLAFASLTQAHRDENGEKIRPDPLEDPMFYTAKIAAMKEKANSGLARKDRIAPGKIPVVFDNIHTDGNWTSTNSTEDDSCTYADQDDGSILIDTMHVYMNRDYCHEFFECDDPDHKMYFKWNRVGIESHSNCAYDWARFAWENNGNVELEYICSDILTDKQMAYRNSGDNKIVFDFTTDGSVVRWGAQVQILCKDPADVNECIDGSHDCADGATCIKEDSGYSCQCPSGAKWGDTVLQASGTGTTADPCIFTHPDFDSIELSPIEWDGDTTWAFYEKKRATWQDAFERCNELGMTLPLPSNDEENTALTAFLQQSSRNRRSHTSVATDYARIFLGAHNGNEDREWVNLYSNEPLTYNQWGTGQPDNAGNVEKVAEMWNQDGDWNDITMTNSMNRGLMCIKKDYADWDPAALDLGEFFCESGLNRCHASAYCADYTGNNTWTDYECKCEDFTVGDLELTPSSNPGFGECKYYIPGSSAAVQVFTYDGEPTIYHQTAGRGYADSVKYCAGLGMHLPVPNTEQQYNDMKTIPRYSSRNTYWLGFTDTAKEGEWRNIYNNDLLAINKWGSGEPNDAGSGEDNMEMYQYGSFQWNDINPNYYYYRSTVCMLTDIDVQLDFCGMNLHDCSPEATCDNNGNSWTCTCPSAVIGEWTVEPADTSTGKGSDGCHYFHPNVDGHRIHAVKYGNRDAVAYIGAASGNMYQLAAKCESLGMKLLTPKNSEEASFVYTMRSKPGGYYYQQVPLGFTNAMDGEWRNIYTNQKTSYTNFQYTTSTNDNYADRSFVYGYGYYSQSYWNIMNFGGFSSSGRLVCITPDDGESITVDYCATGFNDCHEGATCSLGGDAGYTCECQPLEFGDETVQPSDSAGTGKSCTYAMPGHDDKTLLPVRVQSNGARSDTVYAFHASDTKHNLRDAIMYCGGLGMHLPLPKNDKENAAFRRVRAGQYMNYFYLGISDAGEDLKYLNVYTGEEVTYTNWGSNQPVAGSSNVNVGLMRNTGDWAALADSTGDYYLRTICQQGAVDVSKFDWCAAGLHECHIDAECKPSTDKDVPYTCECRDPEFYAGDGIGDNGCVFKLGSKFLIDNYNVDVNINDRYVRTQIAVSVENKNTNSAELYEFGVNLDQYEFISGLTMRMGDDGQVSVGDVHKEKEAEEIFDDAVSNGQGAAITSTETVTRDTTFSTKVNVPAGKKLYIWLSYDMQLSRERAFYAYQTNVFPFDPVSKMSISVSIEETRAIDATKTAVYWESVGRPSGRRAPRSEENGFKLKEASASKWEYSFEKESIDAEQWNDNLMIEYDLERHDNTCGDIVMRDGYFIHYIAPKGLSSIPKNVILTIDTSGSMGYTRMQNAKTACATILNSLTDQDTFWLQEFNSWTYAYTSSTLQATAANKENALRWINSLSAGGGTALYQSVWNSVNRPLDSNRANLAFIISDGYPTSGITRWPDIQAGILSANSITNNQGEEIGQKWALYNFGIGNGAPMYELNKLSTWNMGVGRQVLDESDVQADLVQFFNEYSIPLVWNNEFHYGGASEYDCSGKNLYADQELTCIGKLQSNNQCGDVDDLGFTPGNTLLAGVDMMSPNSCKIVDDTGCSSGSNDAPAYDSSDLMANPYPKSPKPNLQKVFAYQQMQRKLKLYADSYVDSVKEALKTEIEEFAVLNDFVTDFTSMVVTDATRRKKPVDGVTIKKRRSKEKQHKLKQMFQEYREEVKRLKALEQGEIEAAGGLKNMEKRPEFYTVIEEPVRKKKNQSRGRREAFTSGSGSNFRLFGAMAMIFSVLAVLPIRRAVQRVARNLFY